MGRILAGSNTSFHSIYYNFGLVGNNPDDSKIADLYLAAGANLLVGNDTQVLQLKKLVFPTMTVVTLQEFSAMI